MCVDMADGKKVLIPTQLPWESQGSTLCLSFPLQKGGSRLLMGERLWDVLVDLLPEKSPLLMQCTNAPCPAVSLLPAVNEHTLMTPPCSLGRGSLMFVVERVNLAPSLDVSKAKLDGIWRNLV